MEASPRPRDVELSEIDHRFKFHPATEDTGPMHDRIREVSGRCATDFAQLLPAGREKSLALTKLEEAMFWANAAIARAGD